MIKTINKKQFKKLIETEINQKFGEKTVENEIEICQFIAGKLQEYYVSTGKSFIYKIDLSAKNVAENYEPKFKKPGAAKSTKLFSPDSSQRTQNSPKFSNPTISSIWPQEMQFSLLINCGSETTDGLITILGNVFNYDAKTKSTIGIYDTNTKSHIISEFLRNKDSKMFVITDKVKEKAKQFLEDDGLLNQDIIRPVLEKVLEQPKNSFFNKSFFEKFGFNEFIQLIEDTTVYVHLKQLNPGQTKTVYNTLGTNLVAQSNLNLLWSDFSSLFMDEIFIPKLKVIGGKKEDDILHRLLNKEGDRNEPFYVADGNFYKVVKQSLQNGYTQQDLFFLCYLPLYFYDVNLQKFVFDKMTSINNDKKLYRILWGFNKDGNQLEHIYKSFNSINRLSGDARKEIIDEWRNIIFEFSQLWGYLTDFELESDAKHKFKTIHSRDGEIAKQIKSITSDLTIPNIQKLYNFDHDGTCPISVLMLNLYAYLKRSRNLTLVHGKTIIGLIPKHYISSYVNFLHNPNFTDLILEESIIETWKEENPKQSVESALDILYNVKGDSIGSDGIVHIHNQFFNDVLIPEIENDSIFKAHATEQKVKSTFLSILENNDIDYENNPIMLTTHGIVVNYGNPNDNEYLNIGHFTERKDGGLVYVYSDEETSDNVELKFLCESRIANQVKEKNVKKDHNKWWTKQIMFNNYNVEQTLQNGMTADSLFWIKMTAKEDSLIYYTKDIESFNGVERLWKEYKNAQYLNRNLKKIVNCIKGVEWTNESNYESVDYIIA